MKHSINVSIAAIALIASASALAGWNWTNAQDEKQENTKTATAETTREYVADPVHSSVLFKIRHGVSNFYGRFNEIEGSINFDKDNIENSSMTFTVKTDSVDTHDSGRDGHVKSADFFNSRQYPETTFTSTSIKPLGDGVYSLTGEFTLHGTTKTIDGKMLDVRTGKFRRSDVVGFETRFTFKRSDFGMTKFLDPDNPESGPLGDTIELLVAIEARGQ